MKSLLKKIIAQGLPRMARPPIDVPPVNPPQSEGSVSPASSPSQGVVIWEKNIPSGDGETPHIPYIKILTHPPDPRFLQLQYEIILNPFKPPTEENKHITTLLIPVPVLPMVDEEQSRKVEVLSHIFAARFGLYGGSINRDVFRQLILEQPQLIGKTAEDTEEIRDASDETLTFYIENCFLDDADAILASDDDAFSYEALKNIAKDVIILSRNFHGLVATEVAGLGVTSYPNINAFLMSLTVNWITSLFSVDDGTDPADAEITKSQEMRTFLNRIDVLLRQVSNLDREVNGIPDVMDILQQSPIYKDKLLHPDDPLKVLLLQITKSILNLAIKLKHHYQNPQEGTILRCYRDIGGIYGNLLTELRRALPDESISAIIRGLEEEDTEATETDGTDGTDGTEEEEEEEGEVEGEAIAVTAATAEPDADDTDNVMRAKDSEAHVLRTIQLELEPKLKIPNWEALMDDSLTTFISYLRDVADELDYEEGGKQPREDTGVSIRNGASGAWHALVMGANLSGADTRSLIELFRRLTDCLTQTSVNIQVSNDINSTEKELIEILRAIAKILSKALPEQEEVAVVSGDIDGDTDAVNTSGGTADATDDEGDDDASQGPPPGHDITLAEKIIKKAVQLGVSLGGQQDTENIPKSLTLLHPSFNYVIQYLQSQFPDFADYSEDIEPEAYDTGLRNAYNAAEKKHNESMRGYFDSRVSTLTELKSNLQLVFGPEGLNILVLNKTKLLDLDTHSLSRLRSRIFKLATRLIGALINKLGIPTRCDNNDHLVSQLLELQNLLSILLPQTPAPQEPDSEHPEQPNLKRDTTDSTSSSTQSEPGASESATQAQGIHRDKTSLDLTGDPIVQEAIDTYTTPTSTSIRELIKLRSNIVLLQGLTECIRALIQTRQLKDTLTVCEGWNRQSIWEKVLRYNRHAAYYGPDQLIRDFQEIQAAYHAYMTDGKVLTGAAARNLRIKLPLDSDPELDDPEVAQISSARGPNSRSDSGGRDSIQLLQEQDSLSGSSSPVPSRKGSTGRNRSRSSSESGSRTSRRKRRPSGDKGKSGATASSTSSSRPRSGSGSTRPRSGSEGGGPKKRQLSGDRGHETTEGEVPKPRQSSREGDEGPSYLRDTAASAARRGETTSAARRAPQGGATPAS